VHVRFVKLPPEEEERRRRNLLRLQVRSILNAHRAAQAPATGPDPETEGAKENTP